MSSLPVMPNLIPSEDEPTRRGFLTNYPPFKFWRPEAVDSFTTARPLNLYVHVPYCIQRCAYCFYKVTTLGDNRKAQIDRYVEALCTEIERVTARFHLDERPIDTVYFGGGTPTLLSKDNLSRVFDTLRSHLKFVDHPEITVEAEPVTLIASKADHLRALGVNRISMGIQSFKTEIVAQTGRVDTEEHMRNAIELAKGTGAAVNIDLMSGLAGETDETWDYTVSRALESDVTSLTVYKTEIYTNSAYYKGLRRNELELPTDDDEVRFTRHAIERFEAADYLPVNFFTFTKGGIYRQRHVHNSWRGGEVYGFGVSAFGMMADHALQNPAEIDSYITRVEAGELPLVRGYRMTTRERMTRDIGLGMKMIRLERKPFRDRYGFDLVALCRSTIDELVSHDFLTVSDDALTLTKRGILWGDYVGHRLIASMESDG